MIIATRAVAAARCVSETFSIPLINGIEVVSISANVVTNWTLAVPQGSYISHAARNVTGLDFCNVSVATTHSGWNDEINTQVWLPLENWNNRLMMSGGGGLATGLLIPSMTGPLSDGYSVVSTDGGHYEDDPSTWGLVGPGNVNLYGLLDFASLALYEAALIGKSVTKDFHNQPPAFSYFAGCSTGGRQGLMFAQRYPEVFDGILAAAPALNYNSATIAGFYPLITLLDHGTFPQTCELTALVELAVQTCDPLDGVTDGVISLPESCAFDPFAAVGTPITCGDAVVNISYAAALGAHAGWTQAEGNMTAFYPGLGTGAPLFGLVNTTCDSAVGSCEGVPFAPLEQWMKYFLKKDPSYDWHSLTVGELYSCLSSPENKIYESFLATNDPDLSGFRDAGGKMITWHGTADQYIPPSFSRDYYDSAVELDSAVADYYRYFLVPGVHHCGGGEGPYPNDAFENLVAWVEHGTVPDILQGSSLPTVEGSVYQRPVCSYPSRAEYNGQGDVTQSKSWECR